MKLDDQEAEARLVKLYASVWPRMVAVLSNGGDYSLPFLGAATSDYAASRRRVMVVGQQTRGWSHTGPGGWREHGGDARLIPTLMKFHADYLTGPAKKTGWFLNAAKTFQSTLNPGGTLYGFSWRNLFIVDEAGRQPRDRHDLLRSITPLREEIEILRPEVVVFMTGRNYDYTVQQYFGQGVIERYSPDYDSGLLARVKLPWPNMIGLRMPHPRVPQTHRMVKIVAELLREL